MEGEHEDNMNPEKPTAGARNRSRTPEFMGRHEAAMVAQRTALRISAQQSLEEEEEEETPEPDEIEEDSEVDEEDKGEKITKDVSDLAEAPIFHILRQLHPAEAQ